jgi:hypothetical protein
VSRYVVILDADDADSAHIIKDEHGDNRSFYSAAQADLWVQQNARNGWCTLIVELEQ